MLKFYKFPKLARLMKELQDAPYEIYEENRKNRLPEEKYILDSFKIEDDQLVKGRVFVEANFSDEEGDLVKGIIFLVSGIPGENEYNSTYKKIIKGSPKFSRMFEERIYDIILALNECDSEVGVSLSGLVINFVGGELDYEVVHKGGNVHYLEGTLLIDYAIA